MNLGTWPSKQTAPNLRFPNWKQLPKTTRWTVLGMWTQEDEEAYLAARERSDKVKRHPNFAKATGYTQTKAKEKAKNRRGGE
jgi:hypothetical protein